MLDRECRLATSDAREGKLGVIRQPLHLIAREGVLVVGKLSGTMRERGDLAFDELVVVVRKRKKALAKVGGVLVTV